MPLPIIKQIAANNRNKIVNGIILAIDPSSGRSSSMGWAVIDHGTYVASGTKKPPILRSGETLEHIRRMVNDLVSEYLPDVVVIEALRGPNVPSALMWAVGAILAGTSTDYDILEVQMPIPTWKTYIANAVSFAGKSPSRYVKGDENDAIAMGECLYSLAKETPKLKFKKQKKSKR